MKTSTNLSLLFNQLNISSIYCDIDQFQNFLKKISHYPYACSLSKNRDTLNHLLKCKNEVFDVVTVSETSITKKTLLTSNIDLQNYFFEFTPTESNAGGTLLYSTLLISYLINHTLTLAYRYSHKDLNLT